MSDLPVHLDIHLIRVLYLLLCEKSVSRVALKLNLPQSSISTSLRKLRDLTGDPLLVRGRHGMVPTLHGESLLKPAKRILDRTDCLFAQLSFMPEYEGRIFHIAAPDYLDSQFLPSIVAGVRRESPKSRVVIHGLGPKTDYIKLLSDGELDLVIANWDQPPQQHLHIFTLFEDQIACVMRGDCAYALRTGPNEMTVEDYFSLPHIAPSPMLPGYFGVIESFLASQNLRRNVVVESAYFGLIPDMLTRTDLVLTTGRQFMRFYEKILPLKSFTVPIKFPLMRFYQMWHERMHHGPEHIWLRELVSTAAKSLLAK
ncbi:LysR substrate-binding domain-containing protein [Undibacterium arcticum]|uniref:LysR substrate-binding domain-containing protein n=1 Tax=Undibacterium arcticum TaxID=1762892 RepID=UPI00360DB6AE